MFVVNGEKSIEEQSSNWSKTCLGWVDPLCGCGDLVKMFVKSISFKFVTVFSLKSDAGSGKISFKLKGSSIYPENAVDECCEDVGVPVLRSLDLVVRKFCMVVLFKSVSLFLHWLFGFLTLLVLILPVLFTEGKHGLLDAFDESRDMDDTVEEDADEVTLLLVGKTTLKLCISFVKPQSQGIVAVGMGKLAKVLYSNSSNFLIASTSLSFLNFSLNFLYSSESGLNFS